VKSEHLSRDHRMPAGCYLGRARADSMMGLDDAHASDLWALGARESIMRRTRRRSPRQVPALRPVRLAPRPLGLCHIDRIDQAAGSIPAAIAS
jgi:hypothetical protein